jgi:hypothetical protein
MVLATVVVAIPAVRHPLAAYFDQDRGAVSWDFRREWAQANALVGSAESREDLIARLRAHLETLLGPTGTVFWWASGPEQPAAAYSAGGIRVPELAPENPLRRRAARQPEVLELSLPTQRLEELPLVVENHDLIERSGFRVFGSVQVGPSVGILGLAPPAGVQLDNDQRALVSNLTGMVSACFCLFDRQGERQPQGVPR